MAYICVQISNENSWVWDVCIEHDVSQHTPLNKLMMAAKQYFLN